MGTLAYSFTNEYFQTRTIDKMNVGLYFFDASFDMLFSGVAYGENGKAFSNKIIQATVGGAVDALTDIVQTHIYLTPQAQQRMRKSF